jgi:hypothetical protein
VQGSSSKFLENPAFAPILKVAMQGTSGAELRRNSFPLATSPQNIENAIGDLAIRQRGSPTFPAFPPLGQQRFHTLPKFISYPPRLVNLFSFHPCSP